VVAFNDFRSSDIADAAAFNGQFNLPSWSATLCIFGLSLLSWAIVVVPVWALIG
jgi:hypothetical protein